MMVQAFLVDDFSCNAVQFVGTGVPPMLRAQSRHPLDPLSAAEISVAVATVRAAGATPEVVTATMQSLFYGY